MQTSLSYVLTFSDLFVTFKMSVVFLGVKMCGSLIFPAYYFSMVYNYELYSVYTYVIKIHCLVCILCTTIIAINLFWMILMHYVFFLFNHNILAILSCIFVCYEYCLLVFWLHKAIYNIQFSGSSDGTLSVNFRS